MTGRKNKRLKDKPDAVDDKLLDAVWDLFGPSYIAGYNDGLAERPITEGNRTNSDYANGYNTGRRVAFRRLLASPRR